MAEQRRAHAGTAFTLTALAGLGLLLADVSRAVADPPDHAPAHGWRRKHQGESYDRERSSRYRYARDAEEREKRQAELERKWEKRRAKHRRERPKRRAELVREREKRQAEFEREQIKREARRERSLENRRRSTRSGYAPRDRHEQPRVRVRERVRSRLDLDGDGLPNTRDHDMDGDGVSNRRDRYPRDAGSH